MAGYRSLKAWQVSHHLAMVVKKATRRFPKEEQFELGSQLRRAALSVPANLVEGRALFGPRQHLRHVRIAAASLAEVDYLLFVAREEGYLRDGDYRGLQELRAYATRLVHRLARSLETPNQP